MPWAAGSALAAVLLLGARQRPLPQGRRHHRPPAVLDPLPRAGRLDPHRRLVRLQRHVAPRRWTRSSGLVAVNSLMAMVGGTLAALVAGKNDPGFVHNGPLAGLVAVCAGSDLMHPMGALVDRRRRRRPVRRASSPLTQNRWKIDDVLGVWPLHGLCGAWGGIAAGIFGVRRWAASAASPSARSWPARPGGGDRPGRRGARLRSRAYVREVTAVLHLHAEEDRAHLAAVGPLQRHVVDVRLGVGDGEGQFGQEAAPVFDQQANAGVEHALDVVRPFDVDQLLRIGALLLQRDAVAGVDQQALALAELAEDLVAGDRPAALGVLDRDPLDAAQRQRPGPARRFAAGASASALRPATRVSACATTNDSRLPTPMSARISSWLLAPYSRCRLSQRSQVIAARGGLERRQRLRQQPLAERGGLFLLQALEEVADARARLAGADERQPRRVRARGGRVRISTWSPFFSSVRSGMSS